MPQRPPADLAAATVSETELEAVRVEARAAGSSPLERTLLQLVERIGGQAHARAVFGEPVTHADVTVIPVARVAGGFGGGASSEANEQGLGVGGGFAASPIGFIEIAHGHASFRAIDVAASSKGLYGILASAVGGLAMLAADKLSQRKASR